MNTKKQKIRKRKTFRGGMKRGSNTWSNRGLNELSNTWSNSGSNSGSKSGSNTGSNTGVGLKTSKQLRRFLKKLKGYNSNTNFRSISEISHYDDKNPPDKVKKLLNEDASQQDARQAARQAKSQSAEQRAKSGRERLEKKAKDSPVNSNVGKSANDKEEKDTQETIRTLNVRLSELKNPLPKSGLGSFFSFLGGPTKADIAIEIASIEKQIKNQQDYLNVLKEDSRDREKPISYF